METKQPSWKILYSTDCERVLIDETGVYSPEMEVCQEIFDSSESSTCKCCDGSGIECDNPDCEYGRVETGNKFEVFRFSLDRYKIVTWFTFDTDRRYLVPFAYDTASWKHPIKDYQPWFKERLGSVSLTNGTTVKDIVDGLCSENPKDLAFAYSCIGGHFGFNEFDHAGLTLTEKELDDRWGK